MTNPYIIVYSLLLVTLTCVARGELPADIEAKIQRQADRRWPTSTKYREQMVRDQRAGYVQYQRVLEAQGVPNAVFSEICRQADRRWPESYKYRAQMIREQVDGYAKYQQALADRGVPEPVFTTIRRQADRRWPESYKYRAQMIREQVAGYRRLQRVLKNPQAPEDVFQRIRHQAETRWPESYKYQAQMMTEQLAGYAKKQRPVDRGGVPDEVFELIKQQALRRWPESYKYEAEMIREQVAGYRALQTVLGAETDLPSEVLARIRQQAERKWPGSFKYQAQTIREQADGYRALTKIVKNTDAPENISEGVDVAESIVGGTDVPGNVVKDTDVPGNVVKDDLVANHSATGEPLLRVGNSSIAVPTPAGYHRVDGRSKSLDQFFSTLTFPGNRLLAYYGNEADLGSALMDEQPRLSRSFNVQARTEFENERLSDATFAQLREHLRLHLKLPDGGIGDQLRRYNRSVELGLKGQFPSIDLQVGEPVLLGAHEVGESWIEFSSLTKYGAQTSTYGSQTTVVANTGSTLNVNGTLIYIYCAATYSTADDIDWTRKQIAKWRTDILSANQLGRTGKGLGRPATSPDPPRSNFVTLNLPRSVAVEIPRNWVIFDKQSLITLDTSVEAQLFLSKLPRMDFSSLPLAANYYDATGKTAAMFNIRYYPTIEFTQDEVRDASIADIREFDRELRDGLEKSLKAAGYRTISWGGTTRITINGKVVLKTEYTRPSKITTGDFKVRLLRYLDANDSFTVTISYRVKERAFIPIVEKMTQSIIVGGG